MAPRRNSIFVPGPLPFCSRSKGFASQVRRVCVPGLRELCPRSGGFASQVCESCVPGPEGLRPRSVVLSGTCDARRHRLPKTVPGQGQKCGPGTESARTRNGKSPDRGHKLFGPGTQTLWTGDTNPLDRGLKVSARYAFYSVPYFLPYWSIWPR